MAPGDAQAFIAPELAVFLEQGVAVIVATRDERMRPEANGEIAITASLPSTYRSVQVKGRAALGGDPTDEQRSRIEARVALFVEQAERIGMSGRGSARPAAAQPRRWSA